MTASALFLVGGSGSANHLFAKRPVLDTVPATYSASKKDFVSCSITIKAPLSTVWETVHVERTSAPDLVYSKVLEEKPNSVVFEQKWTVVPFLSHSTCVMQEDDYPFDRIDYRLLKSDHFKAMEGSWFFRPGADENSTVLELKTHIELTRSGSKSVINVVAKHKMWRRLEHIKNLAEHPRADLNVSGRVL